MKKITFLVLHLGYGGAEQAVISQANVLAERYHVEIISFYKLLSEPAFKVDERVKIRYLTEGIKPNRNEIKDALYKRKIGRFCAESIKSCKILYWRKKKMEEAIKKSDSDIIISSRYIYHQLLTKNASSNVICIGQEHNHHNNNEKYIRKQIHAVKDMDYFMPVSRELTEFYEKKLKDQKVVCKYIPHYLEKIPERISDLKGKNIISVGRLAPEKDYEELIKVFSKIDSSFEEWKLHIVGDGDEREKLQNIINEKQLEHRIILHGFLDKNEIEILMYQSSLYLMTSLTESFGLVLIEAQSYGLPCIAYDSAQGAKEIITSGKNGILIENRDRNHMVKEIVKCLQDLEYRQKIGKKGRENALQYSKESIQSQWYEFIDRIGKNV